MAHNENATVDDHDRFFKWAVANGIQVNGVTPADFLDAADEIMLTVPVSTMLNIDSIPEGFADRFPSTASNHSILAAFLTHGDPKLLEQWDLWRKIWPSMQDFADSLPSMWLEGSSPSSELEIPLPPSISGKWNTSTRSAYGANSEDTYQNVLVQQTNRLQDAWKSVLSVFPDTNWELYSYNWFIVNTRSFYYVRPDDNPPEDWNDAVGLVPFADYFNHAANAPCEVAFDGDKSTFRATARLEKGDEVFMNYGEHPNDYLLVEYGFFLDRNDHDAIYLDDIILPDLNSDDVEGLRSHGYNYHFEVDASGASPSVEVAASLKCMTRSEWEDYVLDPSSSNLLPEARRLISHWIQVYVQESIVAIAKIENIQRENTASDPPNRLLNSQHSTLTNPQRSLLRRWTQIKDMAQGALHNLS
ncbi:uncharacterized protein N7506_006897 [Penicillium brevicompactum]|uniref:uncharacterized protein n=1 Tax=Penicillium brevicompactum TaxID=5074 RepID=UPI00253FB3F1|nr:uncharacterized protein N7506_006897 [Penicillium brevicompactum]KAJ5333114.1 hypothetical protein N7506_006897 [Penicillium brevicompactum]